MDKCSPPFRGRPAARQAGERLLNQSVTVKMILSKMEQSKVVV